MVGVEGREDVLRRVEAVSRERVHAECRHPRACRERGWNRRMRRKKFGGEGYSIWQVFALYLAVAVRAAATAVAAKEVVKAVERVEVTAAARAAAHWRLRRPPPRPPRGLLSRRAFCGLSRRQPRRLSRCRVDHLHLLRHLIP